jgi:hypothetical protein
MNRRRTARFPDEAIGFAIFLKPQSLRGKKTNVVVVIKSPKPPSSPKLRDYVNKKKTRGEEEKYKRV